MTILDENIREDQRELLRRWRIPVRQIGADLGRKGMKDPAIVRLLHSSRNSTFFTRDVGFYDPHLCHAGYCIVMLAVEKTEVAIFVRRMLRHRSFNTQTQRMGAVLRVSSAGISLWRLHSETETRVVWSDE